MLDPVPSSDSRPDPRPGPAGFAPAATGPVVLLLAPRFVPTHQLLRQLPVFLFLAAWGGGLFGGLAHVVLAVGGRGLPTWAPFVGAGIALAVGLPGASLWIGRRAYRATSYALYVDRLAYDEGFAALETKTLAWCDVAKVRVRRGWLQRGYGLGTLFLFLRAQPGAKAAPPVRLLDLADPDAALAHVQALVTGRGAASSARAA